MGKCVCKLDFKRAEDKTLPNQEVEKDFKL